MSLKCDPSCMPPNHHLEVDRNLKGDIIPIRNNSTIPIPISTHTLMIQTSSSQRQVLAAFCLLIKDDNDILSDWIADHYHVFRIRRLIVAVDPDRQTSPLEVLKHWGGNGNENENGNLNNNYFDLNFTLWSDEDYTPAFFHQSSSSEMDYSKLPNSVKGVVTLVDPTNLKGNAEDLNRLILKTKWHENTTFVR
jgi:hypothetical protein